MTSRNLTDSFIFMRNNSMRSRQYDVEEKGSGDKVALITENDGSNTERHMAKEHKGIVNSIQYEFTKIQQKMKTLISLHDRHLNRASLDDNLEEDREIEIQTKELTQIFINVHRQLSQLSSSGRKMRLAGGSSSSMANNIQSNLARTLQDLSVAFRRAQSQYLTKLKNRDDRLKGFFNIHTDGSFAGDQGEDSDGLTDYHHQDGMLRQTQLTEDNTRAVIQREQEINQIVKSIQELNEIFRDISQMVTVQGSVIDRIDHNIEHTQMRVKEGLNEIEKAQKYQKKNRKMLIIIVLAVIVSILFVVLIVTKLI